MREKMFWAVGVVAWVLSAGVWEKELRNIGVEDIVDRPEV